MRNAGRLKLGYYPLPIEEAQNIRALLRSHELRIGYTVDGIAGTKPCYAIANTLHDTGKCRT